MDPLQKLSDVIAQLDAVASFAVASVSAPVPYVRPRLSADGRRRMELLQARHPCMETDADTAFIPNDITFVQGEKSFYIITGEKRWWISGLVSVTSTSYCTAAVISSRVVRNDYISPLVIILIIKCRIRQYLTQLKFRIS